MKKKISFLGIFMMLATLGFSQFEIKTNPIGLLFGQVPLSAEYIVTDNIGVELSGSFNYGDSKILTDVTYTGIISVASIKYYFNPNLGGDNIYAFPYFRFVNRTLKYKTTDYSGSQQALGAGFGLGYKWVSEKGILVDINAGLGKNFSNKVTSSDPTFDDASINFIKINGIANISVGYRF